MNVERTTGAGDSAHDDPPPGQVPQMGRSNSQLVAPVSKPIGIDGISGTHQPERSWLNADAPLNMVLMWVTFDVFQSPMS